METFLKTKDYEQYKFIKGNRDISEPHVRRLMKSIQEEQLVSFVIVNGKNEIIDGQNRFEACKRLGLPIYVYSDSKTAKYGINQVQRYNTNNLTWNKKAYLRSYCNMGVESYVRLKEFMDNNPMFGISSAIAIISNKPYGDRSGEKREDGLRYRATKPFEQGQLTIDDLGLAYENAGKIKMYAPHYFGYNRRSFVSVLISLFNNKKFDNDTMLKKLELQPGALHHCRTADQYRTLIEDIYNYKSREKVNLRY